MMLVEKALSALIRERGGEVQLLVFDYPEAGLQIPKGTVERDESIADATIRELEEESGLRIENKGHYLGYTERVVKVGSLDRDACELHRWHISLFYAPASLPDRWSHHATGSPEEDGLIFEYKWLSFDDDLAANLAPEFAQTSAILIAFLREKHPELMPW